MLPTVTPPGASISEWKGPDMVSLVDPGVESSLTIRSAVTGGASSLSSRADTGPILIVPPAVGNTHQSDHTSDTSAFFLTVSF